MCGTNKGKMKFGSISKLPSLELEMKDAIRKHIIMKRQRLKQELEQEAIIKRLKKEREQKRIQDAMTLDQIKDQLSNLEKKLETLRSEKHNLFVQLKQLLSESNSKKRSDEAKPVESSEASRDAKRPRLEVNGKGDDTDGNDKEIHHGASNKSESNSGSKIVDPTSSLASNDPPLKQEDVVIKPPLSSPLVQGKSKHPPSQNQNNSTPIRISEQQNFNLSAKLPSKEIDHNRAYAMNHHNRQILVNLTKHDPLPPPNVISQNFASLQNPSRGQPPSGVDRYFPAHLPPDYLLGAWDAAKANHPLESIESRLISMPLFNPHNAIGDLSLHQMQLKLLSQQNMPGNASQQANNVAAMNDFELLDLKKHHGQDAPIYLPQFSLREPLPGLPPHLNTTLMGSMQDSSLAFRSNMSFHQSPRKPLTNRNTPGLNVDYASGHIKSDIQQQSLATQYAPGHQFYALMPSTPIYSQSGRMDMKQLQAQQMPHPATHSGSPLGQHYHQQQIPRTFHRASLGDVYNRSSSYRTSRHK